LLKTLEEPPPHVIFILATTEQYKIPVTILSRCQRYRFKLIPSNKMSMAIKNIGYKDGFEIDNEALNIVTTASCGSMRDALSLLDQAVSLSAGKVTGESIRELLGLLPKDVIASITENIAKNDIHAILRTIKEITEQGYNISQFSRDLRDHLRRIMIYSINPEIIEISSEDKKLFDTQKELFSIARHVRMNNLLSKALEEMRWYDQPKILIEMYLLKISEPYYDIGELINRLAELEKSVKGDINLRSSFAGQSLAKEEKIVATSKILASIDLMNVWHEIISEITKKHLIIVQSLKKAFIKIINISSIQLTVTRRLDYESILEFKDQILNLFEKKTGLNITIEVVVDKKKNIFKNDIEQRENVIFKDENFTKTQQTTVPKYIEEIAKKFDSTAKKI
jgi:DNA polymerase-3 subunit gamma/tau